MNAERQLEIAEARRQLNAKKARDAAAPALLEELIAELLNLNSPIPVSEELWNRLHDWTTGEVP